MARKIKEKIRIEIWKEIPGFSKYQVSNNGLIKNIKTNKILTNKPRAGGYVRKHIVDNNGELKTVNVHWCICIAFYGIPPHEKMSPDHINKVRHDNRVENLRWATNREQNLNQTRKPKGATIRFVILQICPNTKNILGEYISIANAKIKTGIDLNASIMNAIKHGIVHKGFIWKFKECISLENEIWKQLKKNNKILQISTLGRIKDLQNREIFPNKTSNGYLRIHMKGQQLMHRMVAETFLDNPNNLPMVNHKDSDKTNNKLCNLEWITRADNIKHAWENGMYAKE